MAKWHSSLWLYMHRKRLFWWLADLTGVDEREWEKKNKKLFHVAMFTLLFRMEGTSEPHSNRLHSLNSFISSSFHFKPTSCHVYTTRTPLHTSWCKTSEDKRPVLHTNEPLTGYWIKWISIATTLQWTCVCTVFQMQSVFRFTSHHLFIIVIIMMIGCHFHKQRAITNSHAHSGSTFCVSGCWGVLSIVGQTPKLTRIIPVSGGLNWNLITNGVLSDTLPEFLIQWVKIKLSDMIMSLTN